MNGRLLPLLWCFLILTGLSGSAAPPVFPAPLSTDFREAQALGPAGADTGVPAPAPAPAPEPAPAPAPAPPAAPPLVSLVGPPPVGVPGSWRLVLDDEFDALNTALWTPYWFADCTSDSAKNKVATCSGNVTVANGVAVLQLSDALSGALLSTNPKDGVPGHVGFEFTSGYVEARILFPGTCASGLSNWAAWWTAGQQFPLNGEVDIAEVLGGHVESLYHSTGKTKQRAIPGCFGEAYHTYGLHRGVGVNDVYYDGQLVHSYPTTDGNSPNYLILNVGVTGPRIFGEAGSMKVDYVRAWQ